MENPHDQQHKALLNRIAANVGKLNTTVKELNTRVEAMNKKNKDIAALAHTWSAYNASVNIHLESTKHFPEPL
ncbi:DASH complex subunit Dad4 [Spinellus fusiger]|nr:DASH complex subunit Dad4 [Spinellus fusiger]